MKMINPAFDFLRKFKNVEDSTEELVMKKIGRTIPQSDLIGIFEKGVAGEFGKFVVADPQTILSWIAHHRKGQGSPRNYLSSGLLDPSTKITAHNYPVKSTEWEREVNKCFTAFLNGVSGSSFHPHVYDRMMLDGKIQINAYLQHYSSGLDEAAAVMQAKQAEICRVFSAFKNKGWSTVYFIS